MSDFSRDNNRAVWFDIPVVDLGRACTFYSSVLACKVEAMAFEGMGFGLIEHADGNGGCLVIEPDWITSTGGLLLYFNVHGRIHDAVKQTIDHGGKMSKRSTRLASTDSERSFWTAKVTELPCIVKPLSEGCKHEWRS